MYNDGGVTDNFWTGYYDSIEDEYVYPSAHQNFVIKFDDFYLSADDGDFTTDGVTITSEVCQTEDITIGNAPAKVLSATILNPDGAMESLTWGYGAAYVGVATATATADVYQSYPVHILVGTVHYGIDSSGNARRNTTNYTLGGTPVAVISNATGTDVLFITDTKIGRYNGSFSVISTPTASQAYLAAKYRAMAHTVGVLLDANGCPAVYNSVELDTKTTLTNIPMGIFDFSNVDAYGITFNAEAYDKMTLFDADATDWVQNLDFTSPKTLSTLISELMTEMGLSYSVSASAVNTSLSWSENPITSYAVTYRQVLKWLSEAIGCNVRMSRIGTVEFYVFDATPVATITPDTIISNTRAKNRYTVPQITKVICYNTVGAGYEDGTSGSDYYVVANPFIDPSSGLTPVTALLGLLDDIPAYYPTFISVACYDPRIDIGDIVTVEATDGTTYNIPIMHQSVTWVNTTKGNVSATGRQVREIPQSMTDGSDLSGVVSSNPAAVVNMIQAHGISADWITAGRLTVKDALNNILFDADIDTDSVEIAGYSVSNALLSASKTREQSSYPGHNESYTATLSPLRLDTSYSGWHQNSASQWHDYDAQFYVSPTEMYVYEDNSTDPIGNHVERTWLGAGDANLYTLRGDGSSQGVTINRLTDVNGLPAAEFSVYYNDGNNNTTSVTLRPDHILVRDAPSSYVQITPDEILFTNNSKTKSISLDGPTPTSGYAQVNSMASGTAYHTITSFSLDPGTYIVQVHFAFAANTSGRRVGIVSYSQDSSSQIASMWRASAAPVNGENTFLNICGMVKPNSTTTFYLNAMQNSGSGLNTFASYNYVRLA